MRKHFIYIIAVIAALMTLSSCHKDEPVLTNYNSYRNFFASSVMDVYYLWKKEISEELDSWKKADNSKVNVEVKVKSIRYKENGKDYDKWTMVTDDYESFVGEVSGTYYSYGFDYSLYYLDATMSQIVAVVTVVYKDSPADKAGLKRGDTIEKINGKTMTPKDYSEILSSEMYLNSSCEFTLYNGKSIRLSASEMYENPVVKTSVFNIEDTKVGYLAYTSFTQKSIPDLIEVCQEFKNEGVSEMILDLRYNSGGYITAENALASMLAPQEAVENGDLFQIERYNDEYEAEIKKQLGEDALKSFFKTSFTLTDSKTGEKTTYSTKEANLDLKRLYVITSRQSASASESIIVGLSPYLDITLIGEQTVGKFCGGYVISADEWAEYITDKDTEEAFRQATGNWGIYVMVSTYFDKNGNNPAMPDGLSPDIEASDNPLSGYDLGSAYEPMTRIALEKLGMAYPSASSIPSPSISQEMEMLPQQPLKKSFGYLIKENPIK